MPGPTVTPPGDTAFMQPQLFAVEPEPEWRLDEETKALGRRGVAEAREALRRARAGREAANQQQREPNAA